MSEIVLLENHFDSGVKKKPQNPTNWQFKKLMANKEVTQESLPIRKSLRSKFPHVYEQPCGNCTSNAVLACDAYWYHTDNWDPSTIFTYYNQHVMEGDDVKEDSGSTVEIALDCVRKLGACNAKVWPNTKPFSKKPSKAAYKDGLKGHEVTTYHQVKSLLQIKKAINKGYPVPAAMTWAFKYVDSNTWIFRDPTKEEIDECDKGHAIVIVGYDDEKQIFEIRNSWGPNWCNGGYAYISYKAMKKCIWFEDSYAVVK